MSALNENLSDIVETLMARFSSSKGYKAFGDAISTSQSLSAVSLGLFNLVPVRDLHDRQGIRTVVVSNGDNRIREWHMNLSSTRHSW